MTLQHFTSLLNQNIKELGVPELINNGEIPCDENESGLIMEFEGYSFIELSYDINEHGTLRCLDLSILLQEDDDEETQAFQEELLDNYHLIFPILRDYLGSIYQDITNNDPCSFLFRFDSGHATMPGEDGCWTISVEITDYLS